MAHYAFLDDSTPPVVTEVIAGNEESTGDWETFYSNARGQRCLRTSYHGNIRGNYAGIGYIYLEDLDIFMPPCPGEGYVVEGATWVQGQ